MRLEWRDRPLGPSGTAAGDESVAVVIDTADDPRKLGFRPADATRARSLASNQVELFNRDGFLAPLDMFDDTVMDQLRVYVEDLVRKVVDAPDPRNEYSIINYQLVCRGLYDIVQTPKILDLVTDLIGSDVVCWNSHLFFKTPRDRREVPLHQDAVYWPMAPAGTVTVWIALDDADEDNGAVRFFPGTHLLGAIPHEQRDLDGTRTLQREAVGEARDRPSHVNRLRAGQVSIHSDLLLHGSSANESGRRRAGLAIRYASADVRPLPGAEWYVSPSIHCRGDIPEWWPNRRRPTSEHPELLSHVWGEFDGSPVVTDLAE